MSNTPSTTLLTLALGVGVLAPACGGRLPGDPQLRAILELRDTELDFGPTQVGEASTSSVRVWNVGTAWVDVTLAPESVSNPAFTAQLQAAHIPPSGRVDLEVRFAPTAVGPQTMTLVVLATADGVAPVKLELRGTGVQPALQVEPPLVSYGSVEQGTSSVRTVQVRNNSDVDARVRLEFVSNVRACPSQPGTSFCVWPADPAQPLDQGLILRAGGTGDLEVHFTPTEVGTVERGVLVVSACTTHPLCDVTIRLEGRGEVTGLGCPPTLDFGVVSPGACLSRPISCANRTGGPLTVLGWEAVDTSTPSAFSFASSSASILEDGQRLEVEVTYCPASLGADAGRLAVLTDAPGPRRRVEVALLGSGGGPSAHVLPERLDFGLVSAIAPGRRSVLILNTGFTDLEITEIQADTAGTGAFSAPGASPAVIPPGGSFQIVVEFLPITTGRLESELLIRTNDLANPELRVPLVAEGLPGLPPCAYDLTPAALDFGPVPVGQAITRLFEVRNVGTNDCLVSSSVLSPGGDPEFRLPAGDLHSQIITPGAALAVPVEYAPQTVGARNLGTVTIVISSAVTPFVDVPLSGTAAR
ncbi:MAG: choice-of-anchor D domain-containing protein [Deltaproteobacteria bacterium]|nr:choice-of-anchor D domain-containing protein [Deltaproteobacteria bacterium]